MAASVSGPFHFRQANVAYCVGFQMPVSDSGAIYTSGRRPKAAEERTRGGFGPADCRHRDASSNAGASAAHGGSGRRILLRQERGSGESPGRQARLHSQPLDQESRTQTRAEEALVPQWPEMANGMRGTHQRGDYVPKERAL